MLEPSTERTWVAETRFSGVIAELRLPRASVARLLPPELCLEPRVARARTAPVLMAFGTHTASAVHLAALRVRTGVTFHEVFFGVRCLVAASHTPVLFVPLMYCDEPVSTWVGNALYGFNKQPAVMEWLGDTFVVVSEGGQVLLRATCEAGTGPQSAIKSHLPVMRLPVVGRRSDGTYASSHFDWRGGVDGTLRVQTRVELQGPWGGLGENRGSLQVRLMPWRISWPRGSRSVFGEVTSCHGP